ncbi:glycosyltransferase family 61 protein, partial [Candidatus Woesearchaeota archaeon]|nr:glycosyltransferase family 61 protein [Candidatus Woesearchaeota archaeon]
GHMITVGIAQDSKISTVLYHLNGGDYLANPVKSKGIAPIFLPLSDDEIFTTRMAHNYAEVLNRYKKIFDRRQEEEFGCSTPKDGRLCILGGHTNFYHFITNSLARLYFFTTDGVVNDCDRFIINEEMPKSYWEYFLFAGVRLDQLVPLSPKKYYPNIDSYWSSLPHYFEPDKGLCGNMLAFHWLTSMIMNSEIDRQPYRKVILSRSKGGHRRVINEDELLSLPVMQGFEKLVPEDHEPKEITEILASTRILITPYGAGTTNILFTNENCQIIELCSESSARKHNTLALCSLINRNVVRIIGKEVSNEDNWSYRNIWIDPDTFVMALDKYI